jgi:hypothetical protein
MKMSLYLIICLVAFSAQAQINQKTAGLRKLYPLQQSFELNQVTTQNFNHHFIRHQNQDITASILSTEHFPKPSTHSIQKAFKYYNSQKKHDYSALLMMGYSLMTNRNVPNPQPQESIRFFPGNSQD